VCVWEWLEQLYDLDLPGVKPTMDDLQTPKIKILDIAPSIAKGNQLAFATDYFQPAFNELSGRPRRDLESSRMRMWSFAHYDPLGEAVFIGAPTLVFGECSTEDILSWAELILSFVHAALRTSPRELGRFEINLGVSTHLWRGSLCQD
jgi:hypothetical protein